ncbi:MAG TPA: class I SAM-dependent methyltransferase [Candidatus Limnocylindrales bacterium]|nr:class I SAM-dependent methyltransferase [Candidatus Limnocylindrales bacterium]
MASRADKYDLYVRSVQSPDYEVAFFDRAFRSYYGRVPLVLREDFCGTAAVCYDWVNSRRDRRAIGVDLDPEPIQWGRQRYLPTLKNGGHKRIKIIQGDVRTTRAKADIIAAQNFSYFCFETRDEMRRYFQHTRRHLPAEGLLVLDALGGSEVFEEDREDVHSYRGFRYVWHQISFDPITHHCRYAIHFRFKDGSELKNAFTYEWRLWTLPELRELLLEAGFKGADVYWEMTDRKTGEGNGVYRKREHGDADPAWVAYLVAWK